jgi:hypothetical protein
MKWPKEGQTMIYKTLHSKSNSDRTNPTKNRSELAAPGRVSSSYSTIGTRRVIVTSVVNI